MKKQFFVKIFLIISVLVLAVTLSSCGKYSDFRDEVEALTVKADFPEPEATALTAAEAEKDIHKQQISLADAFFEAYKITESDVYKEKYSNITEERIIAELSSMRNRMNTENTELFCENLEVITENVTDYANKEAYINKKVEEVKGFYTDYVKFKNYTENDYKAVATILVNYYDKDNEFAKQVLKDNEDFVAECATLQIEENGTVTQGHMSTLQKSYQIILALNALYDGVGAETGRVDRINGAIKNLQAYVTDMNLKYEAQLATIETRDAEEAAEMQAEEETEETQN